jgi:hypothetical protein
MTFHHITSRGWPFWRRWRSRCPLCLAVLTGRNMHVLVDKEVAHEEAEQRVARTSTKGGPQADAPSRSY